MLRSFKGFSGRRGRRVISAAVGSALGKVLVAVLALAVAAALFLLLRDDEGDDSGSEPTAAAQTTTTAPTGGEGEDQEKPEEPEKPEKPEPPESRIALIEVVAGEPKGGVAELSFTEGENIRFVVESDVADHVHLHGYDVFMDVPAGGKVEFNVPATIPGVFEAELEDRVVPLAEITVEPG
jgi:hypothetical protein